MRKNFSFLMLSRYFTYGLVLLISIYTMGLDQKGPLLKFMVLFILLMINSTLRVRKYMNRSRIYLLTIFVDLILILLMQVPENLSITVLVAITTVDLFLGFNLRRASFMSLFALGVLLIVAHQNGGLRDFNDWITSVITNTLALGFFAAAAHLIRVESKMRVEIQELYSELKESKERLEEAHIKNKEYADTIEVVAILGERNRIAGEIHDTIGHSLTGLIMELDLCEKLITINPQQCQVEMRKATGLARETLAEVRKSVRAIKPEVSDHASGLKAIEKLIKEFERTSNIRTHFAFSKQQYRVSPSIEVTIFRIIQEALTNCAKHSRAADVTLQLNFRDTGIDLFFGDNGKGELNIEKGLGLQNMEERVTSLGGTISFDGTKGFSLRVEIPVEVE